MTALLAQTGYISQRIHLNVPNLKFRNLKAFMPTRVNKVTQIVKGMASTIANTNTCAFF